MADEQIKMNDCYFDKKDWRACKDEVRCGPIILRWLPSRDRTRMQMFLVPEDTQIG